MAFRYVVQRSTQFPLTRRCILNSVERPVNRHMTAPWLWLHINGFCALPSARYSVRTWAPILESLQPTMVRTKQHFLSLDERRRHSAEHQKQAAAAWTQTHEGRDQDRGGRSGLAFQRHDVVLIIVIVLEQGGSHGHGRSCRRAVPDPLNPYMRFRQTGVSAYIDPSNTL
jgi:hypothetical protein